MPTRVISDNLLSSKKINLLKPIEFEFYIRLLLCVDDYGFYSADPVEVARSAYPRREDMTSKNIIPILERLADIGLVIIYEFDNDSYLMVTNFINSPRAKVAKYPAPDGRMITKQLWDDGACTAYAQQLHADACNLHANAPLTVTETVTGKKNRKEEPKVHLQANVFTHGSKNNVKLTDEELAKLKTDFPGLIQDAIEKLSLYMADKGDTSKSATHDATIRRWVIKAVKEDRAREKPGYQNKKPSNQANFKQRDYTDEYLNSFEEVIVP